MLEDLQAQISAAINGGFLGQTLDVLVEDQHKGKWRGRTPQNKLVFFTDNAQDWRGKLAQVEIVHTSPWSMQGRLPGAPGEVEARSASDEVGADHAIPLRVVGH
jgi:tRNA-2-methylthio-N6-dimethylallyladenosine synthase